MLLLDSIFAMLDTHLIEEGEEAAEEQVDLSLVLLPLGRRGGQREPVKVTREKRMHRSDEDCI